jgi:RNA polymerase sigma factor (sigma-70 family)
MARTIGPMGEEAQALAASNQKLAFHLARPFARRRPDLADDLRAEAALALCRCAATYDASRGVPFPAYAGARIVGALKDAMRQARPRGFRQGDYSEDPALERIAPHSRAVAAADDREAREAAMDAREMIDRLPPREAEVCRWIHLDGLTHAEAAQRRGCCQSYMTYLVRTALERLRRRARVA